MRVILFANTDWYLYNFRLPLAKALREQGHEVILLSPSGQFRSRLEKAGFRWLPVELGQHSINPFKELRSFLNILGIYRREKPDVVHHFTIKCVLYGSTAAHLSGVRGILNAVTGMGYVFTGHSRRAQALRLLIEPVYRTALKGTHVIFQNPDDRDYFISHHLIQAGQDILIKGSGVNTSEFIPVNPVDTAPLIVLPARMLFSKGVKEFALAARKVKQQLPEARFILVGGEGGHSPDAVPPATLREWEAEGIVEWWGWQEDMRAVFHQATIACLPSYREGLPRALIEACACGLPIIATDVPGCREVVTHEVNGLLIPAQDADALAEAILLLLKNPDLRLQMGLHSRRLAEMEFSTDRVIAETLQTYEQIISRQIKE